MKKRIRILKRQILTVPFFLLLLVGFLGYSCSANALSLYRLGYNISAYGQQYSVLDSTLGFRNGCMQIKYFDAKYCCAYQGNSDTESNIHTYNNTQCQNLTADQGEGVTIKASLTDQTDTNNYTTHCKFSMHSGLAIMEGEVSCIYNK